MNSRTTNPSMAQWAGGILLAAVMLVGGMMSTPAAAPASRGPARTREPIVRLQWVNVGEIHPQRPADPPLYIRLIAIHGTVRVPADGISN